MMTIVLPGVAGFVESTSRFDSSTMEPWPLVLKMPGAYAIRSTGCASLVCPLMVTVRATCDCPDNSQGIWMLIWVSETKSKGADVAPLNRTARSGAVLAPVRLPTIAAMLPGATEELKLAALEILLMAGVAGWERA